MINNNFLRDIESFDSENNNEKVKNLFLVNHPALPLRMCGNGTHAFMMKKFARGFAKFGFNIHVLNDFDNVVDSENNVFVVCHYWNGAWSPGNRKIDMSIVENFGKQFPKSLFLFYGFHTENFENLPVNKYLLIDIRLDNFNGCPSGIEAYQKSKKFVPIDMSTFLFPEEIEHIRSTKFQKEQEHDCLFIGNRYKPEWLMEIKNATSNSYIHIYNQTENFITGPDRISKFLNSKFSLAFQGDGGIGSIQNGVITERVFESLSFGLVTLTDHPFVEKYTNGIVKCVSSPSEAIQYINELKNNETMFFDIVNRGFDFCIKNRNYSIVAENILKEVYKFKCL